MQNALVDASNKLLELELDFLVVARSLDRSLDRSDRPLAARSVARSLGRSNARSLGRSIARSLGRSITRSLDHSIPSALDRSIARLRSSTRLAWLARHS